MFILCLCFQDVEELVIGPEPVELDMSDDLSEIQEEVQALTAQILQPHPVQVSHACGLLCVLSHTLMHLCLP